MRRSIFAPGEVAPPLPSLSLAASRDPECARCGLYRGCLTPRMAARGKGGRGVLVVGEAPGQSEDEQGRPFVGESGQLLQAALRRAGLELFQDCWVTNALICRPRKNKIPNEAMVEWCRPNLLRAIKEKDPQVIVLLGARAVHSLIGWLYKEEGGHGIMKWAGHRIPSTRLNAWVCPTYHPAHVLRSRSAARSGVDVTEALFCSHLEAAAKLTARPHPGPAPDYRRAVRKVVDAQQAADAVHRLVATGRPLAFDYETDRAKPDHPDARIVCCAVSDGGLSVAYPWHGEAVIATKQMLTDPEVKKIGWNCFAGEVRLLTRERGDVRFDEVVGQRVTVLNHRGQWVYAEVRGFGKQETVEVTFARRNYLNTVRATWGHAWLVLGHDARLSTAELRRKRYGPFGGKADQVPYLCAPKVITDRAEYAAGVRHGIILGDGWRRKDRRGAFMIRLCGKKASLAEYFDNVRRPPSRGGDPEMTVRGGGIDLKRPPPEGASDSYLIGFFRGLVATDGHVSPSGQMTLTNRREVIQWCAACLPKVGYLFQQVAPLPSRPMVFGGRVYQPRTETWYLSLSRESMTADDLLRPEHKAKFRTVNLGPYKFSGLGEVRTEQVYCAVVPEGNSFTLAGGLVTGNCKFEERWTIRQLGVRVSNWWVDGMLGAHVADNRRGTKSLKFQAFCRLGVDSYDDHIKPYLRGDGGNERNRVSDISLDALLLYAGLDALYEAKLGLETARELGL